MMMKRSGTLAVLAAVLLARLVAARDLFASANITIGVVVPSLESALAPGAMSQWRAAALLAVGDVNANPELLPGHTLAASFVVSDSSRERALFETMDLLEGGDVAGLVGPSTADLSTSVALASSRAGVNHVDVRSTDTRLIDQTYYSFLHRMRPDGAADAVAVMYVCRRHGWTRIGVLVDDGVETRETLREIRELAAAYGVEIALTVVMAVDPAVGPGDALGDVSHVTDQVVGQSVTRVWIHLVGYELSARTRITMALAGACDPGFTWIVPDVGLWDVGEANALEDEAGRGTLVFFPGDIILVPLSFSQDPAVVAPWRERMQNLSSEGTALDPSGVDLDAFTTRWYHDAVVVLAAGLDAVQRLKTFCAAAAAPGDHANCTDLDADAGDDDETLRRLIRGATVADEALLGFSVSFDEMGGRSINTAVVQASSADNIVTPAMVLPSGYFHELPGDQWAWRGGGTGAAAAPPDRPAFVRVLLDVHLTVRAVGLTLIAASLAFCAACAAATVAYRRRKIIRMSSWRIEMLSLAGGAALLVQHAAMSGELNDTTCTTRVWVDSLGFSLLFGPLFAKMYRISRIFSDRVVKVVKITDADLAETIGALLLLDMVVLSVWQAVAPYAADGVEREPVATSDALVYEVPVVQTCTSQGNSLPFYVTELVIKFALLALGSWLAFSTREVAVRALNDAKHIGLSIYTTAMLAIMLVPTMAAMDSHDRDARFLSETIAVVLVVTTTASFVFAPKLLAVFTGTDDKWTSASDDSRMQGARGSGSGSTPTTSKFSAVGSAAAAHKGPLGGAAGGRGLPATRASVPGTTGLAGHPHSPSELAAAAISTPPTALIPRRISNKLVPIKAPPHDAPSSSQPCSPSLVASPPASPPPAVASPRPVVL